MNYAKSLDNTNPLRIVIPEVIGFIEEARVSATSDHKYLIFAPVQMNEGGLVNWELVQCEIMNHIIEMYLNFAKLDEINFDIAVRRTSGNNTEFDAGLPLDKLIKFTALTISCKFVVQRSSGFYLEVALQETLYNDYWSVA